MNMKSRKLFDFVVDDPKDNGYLIKVAGILPLSFWEGFVNEMNNALPFQLNVPGYNFLGPGTKLKQRLERGDKVINPLDESVEEHIGHRDLEDHESQHKADNILQYKAWNRVFSKDAPLFSEKYQPSERCSL
jgi:hypothetical protein